eukprot:CAMPEP_0114622372 /NCGR_PEP_ID=MMETSP0168-20121206/9707_1 /TAXON_ID=95228 ORGANISM="Vannella sp., Strain DIVA3 517/6/12" /NCGR_SAMPLE_ID=MMETSP0168 /ASSEMBLY_ACC=CAM_ASM_000044 /LENGTH=229 /DNA_ID=CAMNT_0001833593 /DNA_START=36 /DNA_END=721 /DNA_ORIENTATION=+
MAEGVKIDCNARKDMVLPGLAIIFLLLIVLFLFGTVFTHGYMHATWYNTYDGLEYKNVASVGLFSIIQCAMPATDSVATSWRCFALSLDAADSSALKWASALTCLTILGTFVGTVVAVFLATARIALRTEQVKEIHFSVAAAVAGGVVTSLSALTAILYPSIAPKDMSVSDLAGPDVTDWDQYFGWTIVLNVFLWMGFAVAFLLLLADAIRTFLLNKRSYTRSDVAAPS